MKRNIRRWGAGLAIAGLVGILVAACGHGRHRHGFFGHHQIDNVGEARERVEHVAGWVLDRMDATEDQETRIQAILDDSVGEMFGMRKEHRANRDALIELLSEPNIDRQALEALRRNELQLAEAASTRMVVALADVAEVLTVEQRREMLEHITSHHHD